jgi:hypothetical protein
MFSYLCRSQLLVVLLLCFFGCGVGPATQYILSDKHITRANEPKRLTVQSVRLVDLRPLLEKDERVRKAYGFKDAGNYTYDRIDGIEVDSFLSPMLAKHLSYSNVFLKTTYKPIHVEDLTAEYLDSLQKAGVDAVLTGAIRHYYGYYYESPVMLPLSMMAAVLASVYTFIKFQQEADEKVSEEKRKRFLFPGEDPAMMYHLLSWGASPIAGVLAGYTVAWPERFFSRDIAWDTGLSFQLISTSTRRLVWQDSIRIKSQVHQAMPNKDKNTVAIESFREVVNDLVQRLSKASLSTRNDDTLLTSQIREHPLTAALSSLRKDPSSGFKIEIMQDSSKIIMDGKVKIRFSQHKPDTLALLLDGIVGISRSMTGPFEHNTIEFTLDDVLFMQSEDSTTYLVVAGQPEGNKTFLIFERMDNNQIDALPTTDQ